MSDDPLGGPFVVVAALCEQQPTRDPDGAKNVTRIIDRVDAIGPAPWVVDCWFELILKPGSNVGPFNLSIATISPRGPRLEQPPVPFTFDASWDVKGREFTIAYRASFIHLGPYHIEVRCNDRLLTDVPFLLLRPGQELPKPN